MASRRGFATKKEAKRWMQEEEVRQTCPQPQEQEPQGTRFGSIAESYLDDMQARRQRSTYRYKLNYINRFLDYMRGDFILEELTPQQIDGFFSHCLRESGAKTANRCLVELKGLWNWAIRKNLYQSNPFRPIEPFPEDRFIRRVPTAEEMAKVRLAAKGDERDFIDTLYFTGARLSEICKLTWNDVNFEARTITLWTRKRRSGALEPRTMGMVERLEAILEARWKSPQRHDTFVFSDVVGRPLRKDHPWLLNLFTGLCERAGVERFTAHCIRHHVATRLKDSRKATAFQIKEFLGHMNLTTTEKYLHELDVDRDVISLLDDDPESVISTKSNQKSNRKR
ncbi:tyrosine-type recombinase/integrase [Desulfovibrio sp. OttesenSCG-928-G15]|nr:tyrosine-type recombinase/integrase [Desulfovibrio sp. OttesenSCG-928-G15]